VGVAKCVKCGGRVSMPEGAPTFACPHCGATLRFARPQANPSGAADSGPKPPPFLKAEWYYGDTQKGEQGPFTRLQIEKLLEVGSIGADTMVWREGMADWQRLSVSALSDLLLEKVNRKTASPSLPTGPSLHVSSVAFPGPSAREVKPVQVVGSSVPHKPPPPPTRQRQVPPLPPTHAVSRKYRACRAAPHKKLYIVSAAVASVGVLVLIGNLVGKPSDGLSGGGIGAGTGFHEWVRKKTADFDLGYDGARVTQTIRGLPSEPGGFADKAAQLLQPLREQCQTAIDEAHEKAQPIEKAVQAKFSELERKKALFQISEHEYFKQYQELAQKLNVLHSLTHKLERHVRSKYEEIYLPFHQHYKGIQKAQADRSVAWRFGSQRTVKRCFLRGNLLLVHCGAERGYRSSTDNAMKEVVHILDAGAGNERLLATIEEGHPGGHPPELFDAAVISDKVYLGAHEHVYCYDLGSGRKLWKYKIPEECGGQRSLQEVQERIVVLGSSARWGKLVFAIPSTDGKFTEFSGLGPLNVDSGSGLFVCTSREGRDSVLMEWKTLKPVYSSKELSKDIKNVDEDLFHSVDLDMLGRD
jgi:hypothetical protein